MTKPKFNQDLPSDLLYQESVDRETHKTKEDAKKVMIAIPNKNTANPSSQKDGVSTLQKSRFTEQSPMGKLSALKNGLRRLVYGMSNNKNLNAAYNSSGQNRGNIDDERSPIMVTAVDKNAIDTMEGKEIGFLSRLNTRKEDNTVVKPTAAAN